MATLHTRPATGGGPSALLSNRHSDNRTRRRRRPPRKAETKLPATTPTKRVPSGAEATPIFLSTTKENKMHDEDGRFAFLTCRPAVRYLCWEQEGRAAICSFAVGENLNQAIGQFKIRR